MINFKKATFVTSVANGKKSLNDYPNILFVGRSNVGKSSLLNALTDNRALSKVSSTPGKTQLLNYFLIDETFYLVDAPGFGYASKEQNFQQLMEDYLENCQSLKGVCWLLDSRRELASLDFLVQKMLTDLKIPFIVIFTKFDKLNQKEKDELKKRTAASFKDIKTINFSNVSKENIATLRAYLLSLFS